MKVAIVTPPVPDDVIHPMPLLGPAILRGHLRACGIEVDLVDLALRVRNANRWRWNRVFDFDRIYPPPELLWKYLNGAGVPAIDAEIDELIRFGDLDRYDVVGFSITTTASLAPVVCLARRLKERRSVAIVLGGPVISRGDYGYLQDFDVIDRVIAGDGEHGFTEFLRDLEGAPPAPRPPDCQEAEPGGRTLCQWSRPIPLAEKSRPLFEPIDLDLCRRLGVRGKLHLPYPISRGCRHKCAFCPEYPTVAFSYTPNQKIIDDVRWLLRELGADGIYFTEANMNNSPERLRELCREIIRQNLRFSWGGLASLTGLDEETVGLLARAGCRYMSLGIETAAPRLLRKFNINKSKDTEQVKRTLRLLHRLGIRVNTSYIVEFPGETEADFQRTLAFVAEAAPYVATATVSRFVLIEGSPAWLRPGNFGIRKRDVSGEALDFSSGEIQFDEIGGLTWEQKVRSGQEKLARFERVIRWRLGHRLALRMSREDVLHPLKLWARRRYITYEAYM